MGERTLLHAEDWHQWQPHTVRSHATRGAADGRKGRRKRGRIRTRTIEVRRHDRRGSMLDLELDDLRDELVEDERVNQGLVTKWSSVTERQLSPGVRRINVALQQKRQGVDKEWHSRALSDSNQLFAASRVLGVEDNAVDRSTPQGAGGEQIDEHLVVADRWANQQLWHQNSFCFVKRMVLS
jgi:hypothetical protein